MPARSEILLESRSTEGDFVTEKFKADGFYNFGDGLHTVAAFFNDFVGSVKIQGTLSLNPIESDWFDVEEFKDINDSDSTVHTSSEYVNFYGNFVWIRVTGTIIQGSIQEIRFNH